MLFSLHLDATNNCHTEICIKIIKKAELSLMIATINGFLFSRRSRVLSSAGSGCAFFNQFIESLDSGTKRCVLAVESWVLGYNLVRASGTNLWVQELDPQRTQVHPDGGDEDENFLGKWS
jgi:hypothetical protein